MLGDSLYTKDEYESKQKELNEYISKIAEKQNTSFDKNVNSNTQDESYSEPTIEEVD